jgi:hypothetical protein
MPTKKGTSYIVDVPLMGEMNREHPQDVPYILMVDFKITFFLSFVKFYVPQGSNFPLFI